MQSAPFPKTLMYNRKQCGEWEEPGPGSTGLARVLALPLLRKEGDQWLPGAPSLLYHACFYWLCLCQKKGAAKLSFQPLLSTGWVSGEDPWLVKIPSMALK